MITLRRGPVTGLTPGWAGVQVLEVEFTPGIASRVINYTLLTGAVSLGDRVEANTNAMDRGLGTGGYGIVVSVLERAASAEGEPPASGEAFEKPGHLMKARYTPLQTMVLGADEQDSPHHLAMREADDLGGMPVVVADLHSAVPAIIAGLRWQAAQLDLPQPRVVYIMSDGGALPIWFSRTVSQLCDADWLAATITAGQAFGGNVETVNVHSALLAARLVTSADVAIISQGPGNLGTGTRWGFSGTSAGEAVNAVGTLRGRPVASLRMSQADPRERHRGISHHSMTAYGRVALRRADVVLPHLTGTETAARVPAQILTRASEQVVDLEAAGHQISTVDIPDPLFTALESTPTRLSTMGRDLHADPISFIAAAAAGVHAATLLSSQ